MKNTKIKLNGNNESQIFLMGDGDDVMRVYFYKPESRDAKNAEAPRHYVLAMAGDGAATTRDGQYLKFKTIKSMTEFVKSQKMVDIL